MISAGMTEALNNQLNAESYSAYLYLSMSSYASYTGLKGAANWFAIQAREEMTHAQKLYDYVNSQGEHAVLKTIDGPPSEFKSLLHMFEETLAHEKKVTGLINGLANLAVQERDHATGIFLQWFVSEQIEEEQSAKDIAERLKLAGENGPGLFMIDNELAARIFTPPAEQQ